MKIQNMSDDYLLDLEANAEQTVILWNDQDTETRAIATLEHNDMYQAYCVAQEILAEIKLRMDEELEEIAECQL